MGCSEMEGSNFFKFFLTEGMIQMNLCDLEQDSQNYFCDIATVTLEGARGKIVNVEIVL